MPVLLRLAEQGRRGGAHCGPVPLQRRLRPVEERVLDCQVVAGLDVAGVRTFQHHGQVCPCLRFLGRSLLRLRLECADGLGGRALARHAVLLRLLLLLQCARRAEVAALAGEAVPTALRFPEPRARRALSVAVLCRPDGDDLQGGIVPVPIGLLGSLGCGRPSRADRTAHSEEAGGEPHGARRGRRWRLRRLRRWLLRRRIQRALRRLQRH
mmetsp:Transcript_98420/g.212249  ORF Transcript_98420/g.212249 Transcript_98420/m.212249 type:complete len:211 (+) Transcript_98420:210-842(+)